MEVVDFITAMSSGKRFRRVDQPLWFTVEDLRSSPGLLSVEYVNGDFEIEEKVLTLTEKDLLEACDNAYEKYLDQDCDKKTKRTEYYFIKKELGF